MVVIVAIMKSGNMDVGNKNRGEYGCYGGNYGHWTMAIWTMATRIEGNMVVMVAIDLNNG